MTARPRLGFLGAGWIGRKRLEAVVASDVATAVAIADPSPARRDEAARVAPGACLCEHLGQLLELPLDGVVIATPSAQHVDQALAVLDRGLAVFCQKPLARTAGEARAVVDAARRGDHLLGVDLSYRHTDAMQRIRDVVAGGGIGRVFATNLVFHNAYGPDQPWFYDRAAAGGGCLIDLGIHLVDLALWLLGWPAVEDARAQLHAGGRRLGTPATVCEDFVSAQLALAGGVTAQLSCSWRLPAGRDCVIEASWYGTGGGVAMRNVGGSFYDFVAERFDGTRTEVLARPPDDWGGRALVAWARQLAAGRGFDPDAERLVDLHRALDAIYRGGR